MDKLAMAKDLIKKGTELGDDELIRMGHELLENNTTEIKVDFTNDAEPEDEVELGESLDKIGKEEDSGEFTYVCDNCGHSFTMDRERKRCPECRKQKLRRVYDEPQEEGVTTVFSRDQQRIITDEDGNVQGVAARSVPIDLKQIKYNRFVDDGIACNDAENDYLKTKPVSTKGTRAAPRLITKQCEMCGRTFKPVNSKEYRCTRCIAGRV